MGDRVERHLEVHKAHVESRGTDIATTGYTYAYSITLADAAYSPCPKNCIVPSVGRSEPSFRHGSLGPPELTPQTASRLV